MQLDSFMPVKIISGLNCVINNAETILKFGRRCFVVTGAHSAKVSGALDDVLDIFNNNLIEFKIFDKIEPNPLTQTCKNAGELAREFNADYILGIGGGSVLDAAKAIAIYCSNPQFSHTDIYNRVTPCDHLPVLLVGTTAGTGSEVTGVSVLTNSDTGLKKSISGADCYAEIAFCDYRYTESANTFTRKSTCLDALAHAVESYFSNLSNDLSSIYAEKAIRLILPYIIDGNFDSLDDIDAEKLYSASLLAGLAINITGTCFPHTVGYYLTENFNIPHGIACSVFMPIFLERSKKYCPEKFGAIFNDSTCSIESFLTSVKKLSEIDIELSGENINSVCKRWDGTIKNFDRTPGGFSFYDAEEALKSLII